VKVEGIITVVIPIDYLSPTVVKNWEELVMNCHDWVTSRFKTVPGSWSTFNACRIIK